MQRGFSPCYLHLNRWIPIKDVRKLVWGYLTQIDKFIVRLAHGSKIDDYPFKEMPTILSGYCGTNGYMSLLQWAHACGIAVDVPSLSRCAGIRGDYEMFKWIKEKNIGMSPDATYFAILYNHFALVKWLYYNDFPFSDQSFFAAVAQASARVNYPMLKWMKIKMGDLLDSPGLYLAALQAGDLKLANWLYRNGIPLDNSLVFPILWAVVSGDLRTVKWVLKRGGRLSFSVSEVAARLGKWEIFKWLHTTASCPIGSHECFHIASKGNLPMLIWAYEHECRLNALTLDFPVEEENFECVAWAREHGCPWGEKTMQIAIYSANLKAVQWLHKQGCPWNLPKFGARLKMEHCVVIEWALAHGCPWSREFCTMELYYSSQVKQWMNTHCPYHK